MNDVGAGRTTSLPGPVFSGGVASPVGDFFETFTPGVFEKPDFVAGVFELVDIRPNLGLPR